MKKYLIINKWGDKTYTTDNLKKKDLIERKSSLIEHIIDLENSQMYEPKTNTWEDIPDENSNS